MRIKIVADVGNGLTLPINYNHLLAGVVYRFLAESDPEYASFLHNEGYAAAEKRFKLFTFSQLMAERRRITGDRIHFGSTLVWQVSSPVERFLTFCRYAVNRGTLISRTTAATGPRCHRAAYPAFPTRDVLPLPLRDRDDDCP